MLTTASNDAAIPHLATVALLAATTLCNTAATADTIDAQWSEPTLDRWMYPFNGSPGARISAPTFGNRDDEQFDNRDACMLIGFDTDSLVTAGLGVDAYTIFSATLTLEHDGQNDTLYDDTTDSWQAFLPSDHPDYIADADAGQPIDIMGVAYRNGFDATSFLENSPHGDPFGQGVRNAYAFTFDGAGNPVDASNNIRDAFDPMPWAIGTADLLPGELIPAGTTFSFELNTSHPQIHDYLASALNAGTLHLMATSLYIAEFDGSQGSGEYPTYYTRENPLVQVDVAQAATLHLIVEINDDPVFADEDINEDGSVDVADLLVLLAAWGDCDQPCPPACAADINNDCSVDVADLLALLAAWSP